jgi:formamidopyrimidine-DNA glycosylase
MPELPEVEITRQGLSPHVCALRIESVCVREGRLRQKVAPDLAQVLAQQRIHTLTRRGKYLIFGCDDGQLLVHLGMSGSLRLTDRNSVVQKHDHIDIILENGTIIRYRDPRRFGMFLWCHPPLALLQNLGPEPLENEFSGIYLHARAQRRRQAVKIFLMNNQIVVGVGNIYANESLFLTRIHPARAAGDISLCEYEHLAANVRIVLKAALAQGGTTLRDFVNGEGQPGYFSQFLRVYGREGVACVNECGHVIQRCVLGQRASYYCPQCQK